MIVQLMSTTPPVISAGTAREYLKTHSDIDFAADEGALVAQEQQAHTEVTTPPDSFTARLEQELANLNGGGAGSGASGS
jgi:hypothetical protein